MLKGFLDNWSGGQGPPTKDKIAKLVTGVAAYANDFCVGSLASNTIFLIHLLFIR